MTHILVYACLSLILLSVLLFVNATDICEVCKCYNHGSNDLVISCRSTKKKTPEIDFENLEWPREEDVSIKAFFNNISIHLLPKITGDKRVVGLNLDDDSIRTVDSSPFEYFTSLESISLANNRITELPKNFLKSQKKLRNLILSNNSLSAIDFNTITHLSELSEINLSHNFLTKLTANFLEAAKNVEIMILENNKIYAIDNAYDKIEYQLRKLYLAYNQFTIITNAMFERFIKLESIDLSNNDIQAIDDSAFTTLTSLKLLDLSYNNLKRVAIKLPDSIELLTINNNKLVAWPFLNTPTNLAELEVQGNSLDYIFPKDNEVLGLKKLDASNNSIHLLPNTQFFSLEFLDLSYNALKSVPQNLNTMAPLLKDLILDGNHISEIEITERTTLGTISLSNLSQLERINAGAFEKLSGTHVTNDGSETCVNVKISHNEHLVEIDEDTFKGVRLCYLDLSYNKFEQIPQKLVDWKSIDNGFNLQGNPLACNCEDEWMLDDILSTLYNNVQHQYLLLELRCQSPDEIKNKRLVKFLEHHNPFCSVTGRKEKIQVQKAEFGGFLPELKSIISSNGDKNLNLEPFNPGFFIIVSISSVCLVLFIVVGVKWQRDQNRKYQRRNRLYYDDYEY